MKTKRHKTPHKIIAEIFNVKENYVKSILKIGDSGELGKEYFLRMKEGRISTFVAYSECVAFEKKIKQPIPKEKEDVLFIPNSEAPEELEVDSPEVIDPGSNQESTIGSPEVTSDTSVQKLELKAGEAIPEVIVYQSKDGAIHNINLKKFIYNEK